MNSIILFTNKNDWEPSKWTTLMNGKILENGLFVVETMDSWMSIYKNNNVLIDYDSKEKKLIKSLINIPVSYLIEWKGNSLLKKFIEDFSSKKNVIIDNDHGLICNISELKLRPINCWLQSDKLIK